MRIFVSILKMFLLYLFDCCSADDVPYKKYYTKIFVEKGENIVLNCTCHLHNETSWSGPKISSITKMDKYEEEPYTSGLLLNPKLYDLNIDIIGYNESDECSLLVRNISENGEGSYTCEYWKSGIVYIHKFIVHLESPPNNLTFLNTLKTRQQKYVRGIEGQKLDIVCTVNSGKPQEVLFLKENGSTIKTGASGKIVYSFVPSKTDNLKSFECSAVSATLQKPLTDEVILDIQYKPSLTVDYPALVKQIEYNSLEVCCKGNSNPPLDEIAWVGNVKSLVANDNESCVIFNPIYRTNTGRYTCVASNSIGTSHSEIYIEVKYPPVVRASYKVNGQVIFLHCQPNGEPKHYKFAHWLHRSEFNETIRQIQGTQNGELSIIAQSKNTLHENNGIYICRVSNGIQDKLGMLYQEGLVFVQREAPPIFISSNRRVQLGQYGCELNITAFLYNKFDNIQLNISIKSKVLNPRITHGRVLAHDLFHGVNVTVSAIKLVFHLGLASENDFANYSIEACNQKGCNTYTVDIKSTNSNIETYHYPILEVISSLLGGILILSICFNIYFFLRRKNNSEIILESPPEGQYYEIGPINDSSASIQDDIHIVPEAITSVERSVSQSTNSAISTFEKESSLESSVQSMSNKLPNEDGYENPYQIIDPGNIEMHLYSIVTSQMYQNTIIFPREITADKSKKAFQNDKERSPWLVIYKNKRVIA